MKTQKIIQSARTLLLCFLAVPLLAVSLFAADATLRGVVTDASGKPVRGAIVKATLGPKSISRFTQQDGRYEIPVVAGTLSDVGGRLRLRRKISDQRHHAAGRHQFLSYAEMGRHAANRRGYHPAGPR